MKSDGYHRHCCFCPVRAPRAGGPAIPDLLKTSARHLAALMMWTIHTHAATFYVDVNSPSPTPPYTNWATAATRIQDAIDVSTNGDLVVVTNGTYSGGGRDVGNTTLTNRLAMDRAVIVSSVNGPAVTIITGRSSPHIRCAYLSSGAVLIGFTLMSGTTLSTSIFDTDDKRSGGGAYCGASDAVLSNCVVTGNSALYQGGGVYGGTVNNCTITGNTVTGNTTGQHGGGAAASTLNNSIVAGNS